LPRRIVPAAGERWFHPHDLTFRHLLEQLLESLVHFDGRLLRTVRVLVAQPGRLTVDFLRGCPGCCTPGASADTAVRPSGRQE
jgi:hypothetical protein